MKKNVKNSVIATSILVALAGSFMGCQQSATPTPADPTKTNKDVFEQQLGNSVMKSESLFGKNVVYFSGVNYANNYEVYRFGPMDDKLQGKKMDFTKIPDTSKGQAHDGFYFEDIISNENYMIPGNYVYKLIAKSTINSSRGPATPATPDLSKTPGKSPANQDYWANPSVDIVYLPSISEVSLTVPADNMPVFMTQLTLKKEDVKYVKYTNDKKEPIWELVPKANKDGIKIFAEYEDELNKLVFESKNQNSKATGTYGTKPAYATPADATPITIPASSALNGTWNVYAKYECPSYVSGYYRDSEKVLLDTVTVDAPYPTANFLVKAATKPVTEKENAKYGLTWSVKTEVADLYNVLTAKRATIDTRKAPDVSNKETSANASIAEKKVYYDLKDVTFTEPVKTETIESDKTKTTTFTVYDESVEQGKQYIYFWTITPKDSKRNTVTGATESSDIKLAPVYDKLEATTVTNEVFKGEVVKNTDKEYKGYSFRFTSKIESVTNTSTKAALPYERFSVVSVKRVPYENTKAMNDGVDVTYDFFYDYKTSSTVISVDDKTLPFDENDDKKVTGYGYTAKLKDKVTNKEYVIKDILTEKNLLTAKHIVPISKYRYELNKPTVNSVKNVTANSLEVGLIITLKEKSNLYGTDSGVLLDKTAIPSVTVSEAKNYVIRDYDNDLFVTDGKTKAGITLNNEVETFVKISLGNIKLEPNKKYKLYIEGTDKDDTYQEIEYKVEAKK